jgi:hypothetical protein
MHYPFEIFGRRLQERLLELFDFCKCLQKRNYCCLHLHLLALRGPNPAKFPWSCCLCNTRLWAALLKPPELMYKICAYHVYILSSFHYAGFMLYMFYAAVGFISFFETLIAAVYTALGPKNAINVPFNYVKLWFNTPGYCLCSYWLYETLLQYSWLLPTQL